MARLAHARPGQGIPTTGLGTGHASSTEIPPFSYIQVTSFIRPPGLRIGQPNCQTRFTVPLLRLRTAARILHKPVLCKFVDVLAAAQVADGSGIGAHRRVQPETILLVLLVEPSALALALVSKGV